MIKKRLKKDLPFENIDAGTVITSVNSEYCIMGGTAFYANGTGQSNGDLSFDRKESDLISAIWDNPEWFESVKMEHIEMVVGTEKITMNFKSLDLGQAQYFASGIRHTLIEYFGKAKDNCIWDEFAGFTISIK